MTALINVMRVPVVIQTREILSGEEKGKIKKVIVWCKYIEDIVKYRQKYVMTNGPDTPSYRVLDYEFEVRTRVEITETFEEEGVL